MHENLIRIKAINQVLQELEQDYVFVGGATVSLYATDPALTNMIRPTDDVDIIVELASYNGYSSLDERLREIGFKNDITSGVICRYKIQGITVDVMPTDPDVIGFSNRWYPEGFQTAINYPLDQQTEIKIFSLPFFVASKWEAFKGRGTDFRTSTDFEDLVYVFENAADFEDQLQMGPQHLKAYLRGEFEPLLDREDFVEGLYAHLSGGYGGIDANHIRNSLIMALNIPRNLFRGYSR
jgi:predicted nucleotidyltransferase